MQSFKAGSLPRKPRKCTSCNAAATAASAVSPAFAPLCSGSRASEDSYFCTLRFFCRRILLVEGWSHAPCLVSQRRSSVEPIRQRCQLLILLGRDMLTRPVLPLSWSLSHCIVFPSFLKSFFKHLFMYLMCGGMLWCGCGGQLPGVRSLLPRKAWGWNSIVRPDDGWLMA